MARRINPESRPVGRDPYANPLQDALRDGAGSISSDTVVQEAPERQPHLSDLLQAIEDIYDRRGDEDEDEAAQKNRDETQIYKKRR